MIRLATVFSGIGAIEHALDRMQLEHKIVFACDNGDVDVLNKKIDMNVDDIGTELNDLGKKVGEIHYDGEVQDIYKEQLIGMLKEAKTEYTAIVKSLSCLNDVSAALIDLINKINLSLESK
mgnify:CR=1 FL=1